MVSVRVRARNMCVREEVSKFGNQAIYNMLVNRYPELQGEKNIYISDLFPSNFLYKPISLEQIYVNSDDEYKMLKKLKKAKYIEKSILDRVSSGEEVVKMLMRGEVLLNKNAICEVMNKRDDLTFDFYITLSKAYKDLLKSLKTYTLDKFEFAVEDVEEIEQNSIESGCYVLQSALRVGTEWFIDSESRSMFRVNYSEEENCQYFREGSVFENIDNVFAKECRGVQAYKYLMRRKSDD